MEPAATVDDLLRHNLSEVRRRIEAAAARSGRTPEAVRLVAVTKSVAPGIIRRLLRLGVGDVGENRVQDAESRILATREAPPIDATPDAPSRGLRPGLDPSAPGQPDPPDAPDPARPAWHLIGHLQGNKARRAVALFSWIHSVDTPDLLQRVDRIALELGCAPRILLQVNVSGEASKTGADPADLDPLMQAARDARAVRPVGLMTMAPFDADAESARPHFRRLRATLEALRADGRAPDGFRELSMGMTNDFEVAVEEGATIVRVGRALFEGLGDAGVGPDR